MSFLSVGRISGLCTYNFISRRFKSIQSVSKSLQWKTVIGLEIHAQISSKTKLFSGAKSSFGAVVNNSVSLFDAAIPGTLPVLNKRCVEAVVLTALALDCKINQVSMFDRKHYFYADLPAGYQITQQRAPIAQDGKLEFQVYTPILKKKPYRKSSVIKQIQLEQDSGKSLHDAELDRSLVDLNRAGTPLMELVFEPDLEDEEEAAALVKELALLLTRLGCCSGHMQEGAMRVDANVSVHLPGELLGTRTEIKNIGSIRGVAGAIKYEAARQISVLEAGGKIVNQTMSWDPELKATLPMRDKEVQQDYRFMPEPNLPPLVLNMTELNDPDLVSVPLLKNSLPELPDETRQRLVKQYKISHQFAYQIGNEDALLKYFEEILSNNKERNPVSVANVLLNDLITSLNVNNISLDTLAINAETIGELIDLLKNHIVNLVTARKVLDLLVKGTKDSPSQIVSSNNWVLISDEKEIEKICLKVINENPNVVKKYRNGKKKMFNALMGIIAKCTEDKVNMEAVSIKLENLLNSEESPK